MLDEHVLCILRKSLSSFFLRILENLPGNFFHILGETNSMNYFILAIFGHLPFSMKVGVNFASTLKVLDFSTLKPKKIKDLLEAA